MRATVGWQRLIPLLVAFLVSVGAAGRERPPLVDAAKNADTDAVRALLEQGARVNATEADGTTALHWASNRDDVVSADLLIHAGADVNAANDLGATPIWTASQNGSAAMVRRLLEAGADPNPPLLLGETPVMVAARSGSAGVVEQLLAKGADVNARAARGQTALMWAVAQQHADVVTVLLAHRVDVHARSDVWSQVMAVPPHGQLEYNRAIPHGGNTALMFAARVGDVASAKLLVTAGANVDDANAWGVSATVLAAHSGYGELVEFLLEEGADPNAAVAGFTALHEAIMRRDAPLVATLLAHGADPNDPLRTWTPTRRASRDFNFPSAFMGATPFWLAARFGETQIMRLLVRHGADPLFIHRADYALPRGDDRRREATTALMAAMGMGGGRVRAWVPPDRGDPEARTLAAVQLATKLGIDVNAADIDGRTALDAARALEYETVATFLVQAGRQTRHPCGGILGPYGSTVVMFRFGTCPTLI